MSDPSELPPHLRRDLRRLWERPELFGSLVVRAEAELLVEGARWISGAERAALELAGRRLAWGSALPPLGLPLAQLREPRGEGELLRVPLRIRPLPSQPARSFACLSLLRPRAPEQAEALAAWLSRLLIQSALAQLDGVDPLTALPTRTLCERRLRDPELGQGEPVALLLADLEGLGRFNLERGYEAGDELLRALASHFGAAAEQRPGALAARWGGDELALLLRGPDAAPAVLESLARELGAGCPLPLALGFATAPPARGSELRRRALQALGQAKRSGGTQAWSPALDALPAEPLAEVLSGDLARDLRNVEALLEISRAAASADSLDATLACALEGALRVTGCERALLLLSADEEPGWRLRALARRGAEGVELVLDPSQLASPPPFAASLAEECLRGGEAAFRLTEGGSISPSADLLGLTGVLCAPLRGEGCPAGVLYLDARVRAARFDPPAVSFFAALASQLALALGNAWLRAELSARNELCEARSVVDRRRLAAASALLAARPEGGELGIVGRSPAIRRLRDAIAKLAPAEGAVLIQGESGTGKELVARALHQRSGRAGGPFVAESCAALAESVLERELFGHVRGAFTGADEDRPGLLEAAAGGTFFLDEVGELSPGGQAKLLRALQEGEVRRLGDTRARPLDVRVVAASHRDLREMVGRGAFREDLYYRLAVLRLELPPLREREDDLPLLVEHLLARLRARGVACEGVSPTGLAALSGRRWAGNVRELANLLERAVVLAAGSEVGPEHLEAEEAPLPQADLGALCGLPLRAAREAFGRAYAERLVAEEGSVAAAARRAEVSRQTLYRLLEAGND